MKLWLISQTENKDLGTFYSAVVAAETEEAARTIHPAAGPFYDIGCWHELWANNPESVIVKYLGEASKEIKEGVVCSSFNAG